MWIPTKRISNSLLGDNFSRTTRNWIVKSIADSLAGAIFNGDGHAGLSWSSHDRVKVLIGQIIPRTDNPGEAKTILGGG
jgi:hypothetical protein